MGTKEAWGVLVKVPGARRSEWLTPSGYLTSRRVHASLNWGEEGRQRCERVAAEINDGGEYTAKAAPL